MVLNVHLNEELGIRIYSFPMRYQPTDLPDRSHIGPKWNRYFLRSFQIILQATHGIISGEPEFYKAAFGSTQIEFHDILSRPHHMIFHRQWYERLDGRGELVEFQAELTRLSVAEKAELLAFVSDRNPAEYARDIGLLAPRLRTIARFHFPLSKLQDAEIRELQRVRALGQPALRIGLSTEEIVEDAGLDEDTYFAGKSRTSREARARRA